MLSEKEIRDILTLQAQTAHELKLARAREFIRLVKAGTKSTEVWQYVEVATEEIAERSWHADVEAKILWATRGIDGPEDF